MEAEVCARLIAVNHRFYQTLAQDFAATRQRLQPGVKQVLDSIEPAEDLLDLGCGNGALAQELGRRSHQGLYLGVDFSPPLLAEARRAVEGQPALQATFLQTDLAEPNWDAALPSRPFDRIMAFAALHHLPGAALRRRLLGRIHAHLAPDGHFTHSNWQFLNSPRLRARLQPWETVGLAEADVEPGDYILDWRRGGYGLRYVHHFSEAELQALAKETGFEVIESFYSDGEGGRLGLYQNWRKV